MMRIFLTAIALSFCIQSAFAKTVLFCEVTRAYHISTIALGAYGGVHEFEPPKIKRFKIMYLDEVLWTEGLGRFDRQRFEAKEKINHRFGFSVSRTWGYQNALGTWMIRHYPDGGTSAVEAHTFGEFYHYSALCEDLD